MYKQDYERFIPITIDYEKKQILVDINIKDQDSNSEQLQFILDTGANNSTIDIGTTGVLNLEVISSGLINSKPCSILNAPILRVGGKLEYMNVKLPAVNYAKSNKGVLGLLGMDILGKYDLGLSLSEKRLYLRKAITPMSNVNNPFKVTLINEYSNSVNLNDNQMLELANILPPSLYNPEGKDTIVAMKEYLSQL